MTEQRIIFQEWRDEQRNSRYPFADSASLMSIGGLQLDRDIFLDGTLYPIGSQSGLYLPRIDVRNREVEIHIGNPGALLLASATFDPLNPPEILRFLDVYDRPAGMLLADPIKLTVFQTWPLQEHAFIADATPFAATVCIPTPEPGVRGILLENGTLLTGDVWLIGEDGIVFRSLEAGLIRVDVIGDPLFRRHFCQPVELFVTPRFIKTINGIPPNAFGEFQIVSGSHLASDTILRIYPSPEGLRFDMVGQSVKE